MPSSQLRGSAFKSVRAAFFAGLIALSPLLVTAFVLNWLVDQVGGNFREFFLFFLPRRWLEIGGDSYPALVTFCWNVIAMLVAFFQVTLLGYLTRYVAGRLLFSQTERLMHRVPLIGAIYHSVKQIVETFSTQNRAVFQKVVMVQFPRPGVWAIGFLTNSGLQEAESRTQKSLSSVFIPTTPNPTSGFLIFVPSEELTAMDMTVGEAMKLIVSGGAVSPKWPPQPPPGAHPLHPTAGASH